MDAETRPSYDDQTSRLKEDRPEEVIRRDGLNFREDVEDQNFWRSEARCSMRPGLRFGVEFAA